MHRRRYRPRRHRRHAHVVHRQRVHTRGTRRIRTGGRCGDRTHDLLLVRTLRTTPTNERGRLRQVRAAERTSAIGPGRLRPRENARWTEWTGEQQLWPAPLPMRPRAGPTPAAREPRWGRVVCKDCGRASSILDRALSVQPLSRPAEAKVGLSLASSSSNTFVPTKLSTGATTERVSSGPGFPRGHLRFSRHPRRLCAGGPAQRVSRGISGAGTASSARGPRDWPWAARRRSRGPRS